MLNVLGRLLLVFKTHTWVTLAHILCTCVAFSRQSDHNITRTVYSRTGWKYAYLLIDQSYRNSSKRCHHTWCADLIASSFVGIRNASSAWWLSGLSKYFRIPSVYNTNQFLFQRRRTEPFVKWPAHRELLLTKWNSLNLKGHLRSFRVTHYIISSVILYAFYERKDEKRQFRLPPFDSYM